MKILKILIISHDGLLRNLEGERKRKSESYILEYVIVSKVGKENERVKQVYGIFYAYL